MLYLLVYLSFPCLKIQAKILNIFYKNNINLSYISSRPSKHEFGDYIFIVNFDGHIKNKTILETVKQVKEKATYMKFMGSYGR